MIHIFATTPVITRRPSKRVQTNLYVRAQTGGLVPLSALTTISRGNLPTAINHQGQFPSVTLSFNLAPGKSLSDAVQAVQRAESEIRLPASVQGGFKIGRASCRE